ncbi:MAG: hypothetical protein M0C28_07550 [Candidatus Moduliflexus flocculans]|nr:hypothetical protein [Candidatus Moduliflexus flocculans]
MLMNNQFADLPIILGSIDPCFSCTDRVVVIDAGSGAKRVLGRTELEQHVASSQKEEVADHGHLCHLRQCPDLFLAAGPCSSRA